MLRLVLTEDSFALNAYNSVSRLAGRKHSEMFYTGEEMNSKISEDLDP